MFASKKYEVKLTKAYLRVLCLSVAVNESFVFLGNSDFGKDVFVHCSATGKRLYEYQFIQGLNYSSNGTMGMVSDR
jgi:hypothetical protein